MAKTKKVWALLCGLRGTEIQMPREAAEDCSGPGQKDEAVSYWAPRIQRDEALTPELLKTILRESGAWESSCLQDDDANWQRAVWIAACNWREEN